MGRARGGWPLCVRVLNSLPPPCRHDIPLNVGDKGILTLLEKGLIRPSSTAKQLVIGGLVPYRTDRFPKDAVFHSEPGPDGKLVRIKRPCGHGAAINATVMTREQLGLPCVLLSTATPGYSFAEMGSSGHFAVFSTFFVLMNLNASPISRWFPSSVFSNHEVRETRH